MRKRLTKREKRIRFLKSTPVQKDGWTAWQATHRHKRMFVACCDCGLTHQWKFKVDENGKVHYKVRVAKGYTLDHKKKFVDEYNRQMEILKRGFH